MLELFKSISLNKDSCTPLYIQLCDALKKMISEGLLPTDSRLPSIRRMAEQLDINQVTAVSAYKQLEKEGYAYSRPGSGTYVTNSLKTAEPAANVAILDEYYQSEELSVISNDQIRIHENTINFASATPASDLFPVENFKVVLNEVLERDKGNAFNYQDSHGYYPLMESISNVLLKDIIACEAADVQIISGAQQGIDVISKAFLSHGDYVLTESPTYTGAIAVFKSRGAQLADIQIGEDGPDLAVLEYKLKTCKPKLIYTIPSFQNPTGYSYSNRKRAELLKLAEKYNAIIIEDDYVSDFDFDKKGYLPLKSLDTGGRVIYIKSFSKIFMPGLRLGFMVISSELKHKTLEAKHTTDISTSGLIQRAFDLYIRKGFWNTHLEFMYSIYKERYLELTNSLDKHLPNCVKYTKPGGGLNIWIEMPYGFPVNSLLKKAAANDIVFAPGRVFYSGNSPQSINNIRLSFAAVFREQIEPGISKLCEIIKSLNSIRDSYVNIRIL
ncbi:MAG: PLP-dependent aminotransferase family protein [Clostridia bacterium]|nr:PLP-dependent aminotransferase family protein [Clostridia bacterium]